jgi:lipid II:glycine glycyltransferase (peptidoglycan interpeptide bridge formation enzyme)
MPEATFEEWRSHVAAHPETHLLQTGEWGELKSAFGWQPVRLINGLSGVQILFRRLAGRLTLAYIPKARIDAALLPEIDQACLRRRAVFLKWEPDEWESKDHTYLPAQIPGDDRGFCISPQNIQPPRTMVIDIDRPDEEILARMKQKTRYNIRLAEKKGVLIHAWNDIQAFHQMLLVTGGRDRFSVHSLEYYRTAYSLFHPIGMAELLMAEFQGEPLAALMVFRHGSRAWYVYGASNDAERNRMPTYLLQWEAIRWAKARGCKEYDLWGVPDEDEKGLEAGFESRNDGLWGVYRFKRGFGGMLKRAVQARDRIYNPLLYRLYLLMLKRRR